MAASINKDVPEFFSTQVVEARRFYLGLRWQGRKLLSVVSGGCEHCQPNYRIDRDDFPYYSIEFVARGRGHVCLDGHDRFLASGTVFSYGPRIPHVITTNADDLLVKYFVDFTGPNARPLLQEYGPPRGHVVQVSSPEAILRIFEDLVVTGESGSPYASLLCVALMEQLIFKIAEVTTDEQPHPKMAFARYQECREFIGKNYRSVRGLEEIAERCHIDSAYLCRLFKQFDHKSPYQYLLHLKMTAAARRLQTPGVLVKNVAREFGFRDPFHFSRAFKKVFGVSPQAFRSLR